jgi:hypothetical protein
MDNSSSTFEAVIYTEDSGYVTAMAVGGPYRSEEQAKQCAEHYRALAAKMYQQHPERWAGPPFGSGTAGRCAGWPYVRGKVTNPDSRKTTEVYTA